MAGAALTTHLKIRPPPAPQQTEPQPHTAPPLKAPRIYGACCNTCRSRRACDCHSKYHGKGYRVFHVLRHHRCGQCRNGSGQCFPNCRSRLTLKDRPVPRQWAPPQYPQQPAATAHGAAPPAASLQPCRRLRSRAPSRAPAASAAAVGGVEPSTDGEYDDDDLLHASASEENAEDAPPSRTEYDDDDLWTCKKDLRAGLSS